MSYLRPYLPIALFFALAGCVLLGYHFAREKAEREQLSAELVKTNVELKEAEHVSKKREAEVRAADEESARVEREAGAALAKSAAETARLRAAATAKAREAERAHEVAAELLKQLADAKPPESLPECLEQLEQCKTAVFSLSDEAGKWRGLAEVRADQLGQAEIQVSEYKKLLLDSKNVVIAKTNYITTLETERSVLRHKVDLLSVKKPWWYRLKPKVRPGVACGVNARGEPDCVAGVTVSIF